MSRAFSGGKPIYQRYADFAEIVGEKIN